MSAVLLMAIVFFSGLIVEGLIIPQRFSSFITSHLLVFSCFALAIWKESCNHRARPFSIVLVDSEVIRAKVLGVRFFIFTLLLFPVLMGVFFENWQTAVFNFEFFLVFPLLILLVPVYVNWLEGRFPREDDAYFRFGMVLLRKRQWVWLEQKQLLLSWGVKIFFIPLMYTFLMQAVEEMLHFNWQLNPSVLIAGVFVFGLCVDLLVATAGYLFSSRFIGNEVISTDAHWLGWVSCFVCYPPLLFFLHKIKQQTDEKIWSDWLLPNEPLYWVWAILITCSWGVYWISTVSFGLKFSNLSWRGLVNSGFYRYTKHPAYIAKNIYWWLHTVPFYGVACLSDFLRNISGLVLVSFVYYLRAKTEERHLMRFSEYENYARMIDRDGFFAWFINNFRFQKKSS